MISIFCIENTGGLIHLYKYMADTSYEKSSLQDYFLPVMAIKCLFGDYEHQYFFMVIIQYLNHKFWWDLFKDENLTDNTLQQMMNIIKRLFRYFRFALVTHFGGLLYSAQDFQAGKYGPFPSEKLLMISGKNYQYETRNHSGKG